MNDNTIQDRTLFEITLPRTHDTGAWQLSHCLIKDSNAGLPSEVPDAVMTAAPFIPTYLQVIEVIQKMSLAQSRSISAQLNDGIRAFDLRAVYCSDYDRFHTAHGLIGIPISYLLGEIKQFLDRTTREIVIVQLGTGSTTTDQNWPKLKNLIDTIFGNRVVPPEIDLKHAKLSELTKGIGSRLIVVSGREGYRKDFYADIWVNTMNMEVLKQKVKDHINNSQTEMDKLVALPWCLTPQAPPDLETKLLELGVPAAIAALVAPLGTIATILVLTAFSKDLLPKILPDLFVDLRDVATKANGELESFLKDVEKTGKKRINIITTDHYDTSPAVRIARERSLAPK